MNCIFSDVFLFFFNMAITRGSGSGDGGSKRPGLTDDDICEMITTQVTMVVWEAILEFFGSTKTAMIEMFNELYASVSEVVAPVATTTITSTGLQGRASFQYWDLSNTKPLEFDMVKDPIISIKWLSYVHYPFLHLLERGVPEVQVHPEPSLFGGKGLVELDD